MERTSRSHAIVVGEDEFFCLAVRTMLLGQFGFSHVDFAASLDEAAVILSNNPGISLIAVSHAPGGLWAIRDVGAFRDRFPQPYLILVDNQESRSGILAALDAGLHGYVSKTLGLAGLTVALRQVLEGGIYVPPSIARRDAAARLAEPERPSAEPAPPGSITLTPRQRDVLRHIVEGKSNKEIARALSLGEGTVKVHVAALFRTLGLTSRSAAAAVGARILAEVANTNAAQENAPAAAAAHHEGGHRAAAPAAA